ncbi:hypothetical protein F4802DRAFT_268579 [Xylaria palmicola]|nr:hypothetical protein F4802DRAFT_268579 [Xylaria palmicola]
MTTEQPSEALAHSSEPKPSSPAQGESAGAGPSQPAEFRGFQFFSQRDYNEYKDASRAYFAQKNGAPSSWLGDATPPASARPSLDGSQPAPRELSSAFDERDPGDERRIFGLKRLWFWTLLAITGVIIVVAVGIGVGVGTTRADSSSKSASGDGPASDATDSSSTGTQGAGGIPIVTTSPSPTSTPAPTGPSTEMPLATAGACPQVNGTVYDVPGSTVRFIQLCGVDYGQVDGAVDIRNVYTDTAEDCIDNCAGTTGCTGCGWGFIEGDEGPPFRCWLKYNVSGTPHAADRTWYFAVLL